jgi:hypothetical protein
MSRLAFAAIACALAASGCPRLPPPASRPSVSLVRLERAGPSALRARLLIHNRGAAPLLLSAIDWEIVRGEEPLLRGRAHAKRRFAAEERAAIEIAISLPAALSPALRGDLRLRGTAHLEPDAPAAFDEPAALR